MTTQKYILHICKKCYRRTDGKPFLGLKIQVVGVYQTLKTTYKPSKPPEVICRRLSCGHIQRHDVETILCRRHLASVDVHLCRTSLSFVVHYTVALTRSSGEVEIVRLSTRHGKYTDHKW